MKHQGEMIALLVICACLAFSIGWMFGETRYVPLLSACTQSMHLPDDN